MEDAATAEISRSQIWQWVHIETKLEDGTTVTDQLVRDVLNAEVASLRAQLGPEYDEHRYDDARRIFEHVALADDFADFLTLPAYDVAEA
jgi:malate synthase